MVERSFAIVPQEPMFAEKPKTRDQLMAEVQAFDRQALAEFLAALDEACRLALDVKRASTLPIGVRELAARFPDLVGPAVATMTKLAGNHTNHQQSQEGNQ